MGWVNDFAAINRGRAERGLPPRIRPEDLVREAYRWEARNRREKWLLFYGLLFCLGAVLGGWICLWPRR